MGDKPPPLPPKLRNMMSIKYSEEDQAKALEEEKKAFEKLERSHSQRVAKVQKENTSQVWQRPRTPTEKSSQFNDANYRPTPYPAARPIPKPRSISLKISNITRTEVDNNSNSQNNNLNSLDLMSFVSPEKPKNEILEQLQNINKNQISHVPSKQAMTFGGSSLTSSQSIPFAMNFSTIQNPIMPSNFLSSQSNVMNYSRQNFISTGQNNLAGFSKPSTPFTVPPNIPLCSTEIPNPAPPLPSRSPVVDMNRLSMALNIVLNNAQSAALPSSTLPPLQNFSSKSSTEHIGSNKSEDLIDLRGIDNRKSPVNLFSSVLEDFDPLITKDKEEMDKDVYSIVASNSCIELSNEARELLRYKVSKYVTEDEQSYYESVDPFEYMQPSALSSRSDPVLDIYAGLVSPGALGGETFDIPPPLPPRSGQVVEETSLRTIQKTARRNAAVIEQDKSAIVSEKQCTGSHIQLFKMSALSADSEAVAFWEKIRDLRREYAHTDHIGNPGLLHSPCLESFNAFNHSVKLAVYYQTKDPALFTCNLDAGVEHVVMQSTVALELEGGCDNYLLKVRGVDEYLCGETLLGEYEYVHLCIKNDKDILFSLVPMDDIKKSYLRTKDDDLAIENTDSRSLLTVGATDAIHYDSLAIAVEAFEKELDRLQISGFQLIEGTPIHELSFPMRSRHVRQIVKQICVLLGEIETIEISKNINILIDTCKIIQKSQGVLDGENDVPGQSGMLSTGSHDSSQDSVELREMLLDALSKTAGAVNNFLFMYTRAFRVDFTINRIEETCEESHELISMFDRVEVQVCSLHRLDADWLFDEFFVEAQLFHGTTCVGKPIHTASNQVCSDHKSFRKINFDQWLDMGFRVNTIPLESRLVFTVFGLKRIPSENKSDPPTFIRDGLGWAAVQMFSFDRFLTSGGFLLSLWPMICDRRLGPAPCSSDHPAAHFCPILSVELKNYGLDVCFPHVTPQPANLRNFDDLDVNTQQDLCDTIERDIFTFNKSSAAEREILWEKRQYLHRQPDALAKVLLSAHSWDLSCLPDLHSLVNNWSPPKPSDALHLLLPCFPDTVVRNKAVQWIRGLGSDELITYLPQLVQSIKHEAWDVSKLTELLLERALTSPRLAHHLYWLLNQCLPLQTSMGGVREVVVDARYTRRLNMVTRALMTICGNKMESRLLRQEAVLRSLYETAVVIKDAKDSNRTVMLHHKLQDIQENLKECPTSLPLSPSLEVAGVDIELCSYYTSFTVPLRLAFISSEPNTDSIHTIFKVGDDLRQDMLVIQMIRLMDKLWLKENLDLKIITFNVVATGYKIGILEMVRDAETLRKIQTEERVVGCFEERSIADWLAKQNPSQLEYHRAVSNFTASCAGYCVATYILGICDRHNDNIMIKTSGHLFHIDFGKFLGDAQKFGNIKRDRTPFVLTSDMAYVINGGEKASDKFQSFVDLCCKAFNIIRQNAHLILYLFSLMASSGIPGVTSDAVDYVEKALLQDQTNAEAGAYFAKMIQESLKNWFVQVNFFIHNLAQLRFSGDTTESDTLLSFVPRKYTITEDGRIRGVRLYSFQKRYNPNKYYVYILKVERENQKEPSYLFRSYKEFSEFHQKICYVFPLATIHSLPKGVKIGRSEVKAVAEKRKFDIELFLSSLFGLAQEIAHSDLVYTFLHPLLRDQEDTDIHIKKLKIKDFRATTSSPSAGAISGSVSVQGQVKVSVQYIRAQLQIIVQHARKLSQESGASEPSPYVKLYLLPDPHKKTKRKTKVVKKSCHPIFMEKITYRMSLEIIRQKIMEISVWSEDKFSENSYLGSAYMRLCDLDKKKEICEWLSLEHNIRTAREHIYHPLCSS